MRRLPTATYLGFPLRMTAHGPRTSDRATHVREVIEQVLFTNPGERVFRPQFGAGARRLVFEPNDSALWEITRKRLADSLAESLFGEVDPRTLKIDVTGREEKLFITISYKLAAIGKNETHTFTIGGGGGS